MIVGCIYVVCVCSVCECFVGVFELHSIKYFILHSNVCSIQSLILCYSLPMIMLEPSDPEEKEPSPSTSPASPQPPLDPTEPEYNQPMKEVNMILLAVSGMAVFIQGYYSMHLLRTNISVGVGGNGVLELGFSLHLCLLQTPFCKGHFQL